MPWDEMITVGRVVRPHGNRGNAVVVVETDFAAERFHPGAALWMRQGDGVVALTVSVSRERDGRWVVGFDGVTTIDAAEALRGVELRIPAAEIHALPPGAHYVHDLVGCHVETVDGRVVGVVGRVDRDTGTPVLVIDRAGSEVLVPLVDEICRRVDIGAKRITIEPPEGLLELNDRRS